MKKLIKVFATGFPVGVYAAKLFSSKGEKSKKNNGLDAAAAAQGA
jgi:hypothetical protein